MLLLASHFVVALRSPSRYQNLLSSSRARTRGSVSSPLPTRAGHFYVVQRVCAAGRMSQLCSTARQTRGRHLCSRRRDRLNTHASASPPATRAIPVFRCQFLLYAPCIPWWCVVAASTSPRISIMHFSSAFRLRAWSVPQPRVNLVPQQQLDWWHFSQAKLLLFEAAHVRFLRALACSQREQRRETRGEGVA